MRSRLRPRSEVIRKFSPLVTVWTRACPPCPKLATAAGSQRVEGKTNTPYHEIRQEGGYGGIWRVSDLHLARGTNWLKWLSIGFQFCRPADRIPQSADLFVRFRLLYLVGSASIYHDWLRQQSWYPRPSRVWQATYKMPWAWRTATAYHPPSLSHATRLFSFRLDRRQTKPNSAERVQQNSTCYGKRGGSELQNSPCLMTLTFSFFLRKRQILAPPTGTLKSAQPIASQACGVRA
ncbi:hypothetical protein EGW08_014435 [Elysia chlorotica]|uniref:Uncharacterized protein n=1 Tax=Elysia chlorotica TaxID=188477 RepID=A0A433T8D8_ELYCH|nr:hypothetical protein EGW08_014435 [Elysia chlorotica]